MRDLPMLFITNLDLPETAFNEEALEKPAVDDTEQGRVFNQESSAR